MKGYKTISIKQFLPKLLRDLGWNHSNEEVHESDIVEWVAECLEHIGAYPQLCQKVAQLEIENYKAKLPCDYYKTIEIFNGFREININDRLVLDNRKPIKQNVFGGHNITFDTITTSFQHGLLTLHYLAFPLDEEGLPLIIDDISVKECLFWHIVYHLGIRGFEFKNPALRDINFTRQKLNFYMMQSRGNLNMPDEDMLKRIRNRYVGFSL